MQNAQSAPTLMRRVSANSAILCAKGAAQHLIFVILAEKSLGFLTQHRWVLVPLSAQMALSLTNRQSHASNVRAAAIRAPLQSSVSAANQATTSSKDSA
jgi:hypothetical protein